MADPRIAAVINNARWCDAVCRSLDVPTTFSDASWTADEPAPQYYPDVITLQPETAVTEILSHVDTRASCSVKDSFADLDLRPADFTLLFEASWIVRQAQAGTPPRA